MPLLKFNTIMNIFKNEILTKTIFLLKYFMKLSETAIENFAYLNKICSAILFREFCV